MGEISFDETIICKSLSLGFFHHKFNLVEDVLAMIVFTVCS